MDDRTTRDPISRRDFLRSSTTVVAAGIIGGAAGATAAVAASAKPRRDPVVELPWPWAEIDPLEAGRRAFRHYHDTGG